MSKKRQARPFTLRFTDEERAGLSARAGNLSLGAYIRRCVLGENEEPRHMRGKTVKPDQKALAQILAALGRSGIAQNLSTLAKAVKSGSLPVAPETEKAIDAACADIQAMHAALMNALGFRSGGRR